MKQLDPVFCVLSPRNGSHISIKPPWRPEIFSN